MEDIEVDDNEELKWDKSADKIKIVERLLLMITESFINKEYGDAHDLLNAVNIRIRNQLSDKEKVEMNKIISAVSETNDIVSRSNPPSSFALKNYVAALCQWESFTHECIEKHNIIPSRKELKEIPSWKFGF